MRVAYLDCVGGISGDMLLAALLDAGAPLEALTAGLRSLPLPGWELEVSRVERSSLAALYVTVRVGDDAADDAPLLQLPPPDAPLEPVASTDQEDHEPGGGHSHAHEHGHSHTHEHGHAHTHESPPASTFERPGAPPTHAHPHSDSELPEHTHSAFGHDGAGDTENPHHGTRTFADVARIIRASSLPHGVREQAVGVFRRLAEAEAAVHGSTLDAVHFHEVGAVDSIVDVVGAVFALHLLGVERVYCSALPNGHGFVRCAHGRMPIPPPATAELLKGAPLRAVDVEAELVTPTGAALATALAEEFGPMPSLRLLGVGYGAGKKQFVFPNLVRVMLGEIESNSSQAAEVFLIEANIDDQSPQLYEAAFGVLLSAGALDVWVTPILMKKGRPAQTFSVLCRPEDRERLTHILFQETTTLGVRYSAWGRTCLDREWIETDTAFGSIRVKVGREEGVIRTIAPEYEDCRKRATETGTPLKVVHGAALAAAWVRLGAAEAGLGGNQS